MCEYGSSLAECEEGCANGGLWWHPMGCCKNSCAPLHIIAIHINVYQRIALLHKCNLFMIEFKLKVT